MFDLRKFSQENRARAAAGKSRVPDHTVLRIGVGVMHDEARLQDEFP